MIAVIQRVSQAGVEINGKTRGKIARGLLLFLGIEEADNQEDIQWLSRKILNLRIFADSDGKMNLSILDVGGDVLIVSQFTLHASTKKGNRPSYMKAANPETAIPLYHEFIEAIQDTLGKPVKRGQFGADMQVSLVNDGPVTIIIDSKDKK